MSAISFSWLKRIWLPYQVFKRRPVSKLYGFDRGRPVDRYYIEKFLELNQANIKGRCLEILNDDYTKRFGAAQVTKGDVLDINPKNRHATIHGDLRNLKNVKDNSFDCIILTQVLQFIDEAEAALRECRRILKPKGVLLATVPAVSRLDVAAGGDADYWRFTPAGAKHLFTKVFGPRNVKVEGHGNVLSGLAFWVGLAQEDLAEKDLAENDPDFPSLVTIKAVK